MSTFYLPTKIIHGTFLSFIYFALIGCTETLPFGDEEELVFDQVEYNAADVIRGGKLYDKWWKVKNMLAPSEPNPTWENTADPLSNVRLNGGQWRCKVCHGWDYKGANGAYSSGENYTGVRGLDNGNPIFTAKRAFEMIANGNVRIRAGQADDSAKLTKHAFYAPDKLNIDDIYDLTKFVMEFANRDQISQLSPGNVDSGKAVFLKVSASSPNGCASAGCHLSTLNDIIDVANTNPAEFLHKVRIGSPGTSMPGRLTNFQANDVLAFVKAGANLTIIPQSDFDQTKYDALTNEALAFGGLLYDKWWNAPATPATAPADNDTHPLWPASNTLQTGSSTWRCKECHGWDYRGKDGAYGSSGKHFTGISGIVNTSSTNVQFAQAKDVYGYIKEVTEHGFVGKLTTDAVDANKDEYYALTKFIMTMRGEEAQGIASFDRIDDSTKKAINGDTIQGKTAYEASADSSGASCEACHGADGKKIDFDSSPEGTKYLDSIALSNPWEFIHKLRFGQPKSAMKGSILATTPADYSTMNTAVNILAHAQTNMTPDIKRAGRLYDKWWNVTGNKVTTAPTTRNATWVATADVVSTTTTPISDSSTWRCKSCHGWDYQGKDGAYGTDPSGKYYSQINGFFNVSLPTKTRTETDIFNLIKDGPTGVDDHAFGTVIADADITLLAKFILDDTNGVPPVADLDAALNSTGKTNGQVIYEGATPGDCERCHGANGNAIPNVLLKDIATGNPQEFIHKVRYGHPGSTMVPTSGSFEGLTLTDAGDVVDYAKVLTDTPAAIPTYADADPVRGGRLYDKWWAEMQVTDATVVPPSDGNLLWKGANTNTEDTWRCKSCHGWSYKGSVSGINLLSTIELIRTSASETQLQQYIFDYLKEGQGDGDHLFGDFAGSKLPNPLSDADIWDLTKFLLDETGLGIVDSDVQMRAEDGEVRFPDLTKGSGLYNGSANTAINCSDASCHGPDGLATPNESTATEPLDIFAIAAAFNATSNTAGDPWEFLHKIRFGQPGTSMPSLIDKGVAIEDAYYLLSYGQNEFKGRLAP